MQFINMRLYFYVHFFTCIKKRTKESAAVHLAFGYPVLLTKCRRLGKSLALRRVVYLHFGALLGCVKRLLNTFVTLKRNKKKPFRFILLEEFLAAAITVMCHVSICWFAVSLQSRSTYFSRVGILFLPCMFLIKDFARFSEMPSAVM